MNVRFILSCGGGPPRPPPCLRPSFFRWSDSTHTQSVRRLHLPHRQSVELTRSHVSMVRWLGIRARTTRRADVSARRAPAEGGGRSRSRSVARAGDFREIAAPSWRRCAFCKNGDGAISLWGEAGMWHDYSVCLDLALVGFARFSGKPHPPREGGLEISRAAKSFLPAQSQRQRGTKVHTYFAARRRRATGAVWLRSLI